MTTNKDFIDNDDEEINDYNLGIRRRKPLSDAEIEKRFKERGFVINRNSY
jgi:hypothetical protein